MVSRISTFLMTATFALSACTSSGDMISRLVPKYINNDVKFTTAAYGVAASPRLTTSRHVRKGGGRRQLGKPYRIRGKWYKPREQPNYDKVGNASWYGPNFHGRLTANGEIYDQFALSGAHPTFPLPSYARVTNVDNGKSVVVRINDRGPYHDGRIIDLSARASSMLGYRQQGVGRVRVQYVSAAPLHALDANYLEASFREGGLMTAAVRKRQLRKDRRGAEIQLARDIDYRATASAAAKSDFSDTLKRVRSRRDDGTTLAFRMEQFNGNQLR